MARPHARKPIAGPRTSISCLNQELLTVVVMMTVVAMIVVVPIPI